VKQILAAAGMQAAARKRNETLVDRLTTAVRLLLTQVDREIRQAAETRVGVRFDQQAARAKAKAKAKRKTKPKKRTTK
jgi:hypothetical protein